MLWYIEEGEIPTLAEAEEKLDLLKRKGSSPIAFSMSEVYDIWGQKREE